MRMARNIAGIGVLGGLCLLAACGDPVPPSAQGGISIHVVPYDDTDPVYGNTKCPPDRHWVNVPYDQDRQPTAQKQLTTANDSVRAVNNQDGNKVSCSVKASGGGFIVNGQGTAYAESNMVKYKPSNVTIAIPAIAPGDTNAKGKISVQDDASLNTYASEQCSFSVQGGSLGIDAGKIWASVTCEDLKHESSPGTACQVPEGFFVFENCTQ